MVASAPVDDYRTVRYHPYGQAPAFLSCRDNEVLYEGPAGTGKSFACLWKVHAAMLKYPGARALMLRKTAVSLASSVLETYEKKVLTTGRYGVTFFGGSRREPGQYRYPNGSRIVVGGLDNAAKVMSSEYDLAFVNEATELTEDDWESVTTRLRYGAMPYQQLIADCNPSAPSHWLNQRALKKVITRFGSRHEDNPTLWDHARGQWTERGVAYMEILERLTGVRYQRLRLGLWVAAEGQVYDAWRDDVHVVALDDVKERLAGAWYFGTVDWGWTNPGVLQVWAVDGDDRLYLVAERYHARRPVEGWWAPRAVELSEQYGFRDWLCDPSEPAYIAQFRAKGLNARSAENALSPGITAVQNRIAPQGDERPRIFILKDCLIERDEALVEAKQPWSTVQEFPEYVWPKNAGGVTIKEKPVDAYNHGMDALRYAVAERDVRGGRALEAPVASGATTHFQRDQMPSGADPWAWVGRGGE